MTKIERYKEALDLAIGELSKKARHTYPDGVTCEEACHKVLLAINHVLKPPPEYEDVPLERWAVVAPSGYVEVTYQDEERALHAVTQPRYLDYAVAKLTGTVRREKVAPVERSWTMDNATLMMCGGTVRISPFPEGFPLNAEGCLTFTTTDPPK
jgi:hypothetical protein